ncbi:hypothetical protein DRN73_06410, partial [Candidatus Pacearchaeota archaeon]
MAKVIYIISTGKDSGKSVVSIALIELLKQKYKVAYMKPIAERKVKIGEKYFSEDAFLMKSIFNFDYDLELMSPFVIPSGFTSKYIKGEENSPEEKIYKAFERISKECDVLIVEASGHTGVGSVFDLSNAKICKLFKAIPFIVAQAGVGDTIDSLTLNISLLEKFGIKNPFIIVNKIKKEKYEKIKNILTEGFKKRKWRAFAFLPFEEELAFPEMKKLLSTIEAKRLNEAKINFSRFSKFIMVGTDVNEFFDNLKESRGNIVVISSGDRMDIIMGLAGYFAIEKIPLNLLLLLTPPYPNPTTLRFIKKLPFPVFFSNKKIENIIHQLKCEEVKLSPFEATRVEII